MSIAVIIPAKNGAAFVGQTVESVLWQTVPPDEFVVVDDHSTDDTVAAIAAVDPGIPVITNRWAGSNTARVTGVAEVQAKYLAFVDHDDVLYPHHLEVMTRLLDEHPDAALAYSRKEPFTDEPRIRPATPGAVEIVHLWDDYPHNRVGGPSSVVIRRSALDAIGGWPEWNRVPTDIYLWFRLADVGPFAAWSEPTVGGRRHTGSMSVTLTREDPAGYAQGRLRLLSEALDHHLEAFPEDGDVLAPRHRQYELLAELIGVVLRSDRDRLPGLLDELRETGDIVEHLTRYFRAHVSPGIVRDVDGLRSALGFLGSWPAEHRDQRRLLLDPVVARAVTEGPRTHPLSPRDWALPATPDLWRAAGPVAAKLARGSSRRIR